MYKNISGRKCCICGKEFWGFGNNAEPIKKDGTCCDNCNFTVVLPQRLSSLNFTKKEK